VDVTPPAAPGQASAAADESSAAEPPLAASLPQPPPVAAAASPAAGLPPSRAVIHSADQRRAVNWLASGLGVVAAISIYPAVSEVAAHLSSPDPPGLDRWVSLALLLGIIQFAFVVYLVQLPDWSTTKATMVLAVGNAMLYATALGVSVMADNNNQVVLWLGLASQFSINQVRGWCFLMLLLMCSLAYFAFGVTFPWQKSGGTRTITCG
jgi:hypothetical protein